MGRESLYIGIDGGASNTRALLGIKLANGMLQELGRGTGGSSNINNVGAKEALQSLHKAVENAFSDAKLQRTRAKAACLGIAGSENFTNQGCIKDWTHRVALADHVEIVNDALIILTAGTPDEWGVAVIAGTGSSVFVRSPRGEVVRTGGWGYLIGDPGSGYSLGIKAIRAITDGEDAGAHTVLTARFLKATKAEKLRDLPSMLGSAANIPAFVAGFAPLVLEAAQEGDMLAKRIAEEEANALARLVALALTKLRLDPNVFATPMAVTGSVLLRSEWYRNQFVESLGRAGVRPMPFTSVHEPVEGALKRAFKAH